MRELLCSRSKSCHGVRHLGEAECQRLQNDVILAAFLFTIIIALSAAFCRRCRHFAVLVAFAALVVLATLVALADLVAFVVAFVFVAFVFASRCHWRPRCA